MSSTYTFAEILSLANTGSSRAIEGAHAASVLNLAQNLFWNRYDWRFSLKKLPPFWLVPKTQDYAYPLTIIPTDFMGLRQMELVSLGQDQAVRPITVTKDLNQTNRRDLPRECCFIPDQDRPNIGIIRVYPRTPEGCASPQYFIRGTYKKQPTLLTPSSYMTTTIPSMDYTLDTWVACTQWAIAFLSKDPRAHKELLPLSLQLLQIEAQREGLDMGDPILKPSEPLIPIRGIGSFPYLP